MNNNIKQLAYEWVRAEAAEGTLESENYCKTRDVFEARNDKMLDLLINNGLNEDDAYLVYAIAGELCNNAFDHNLGNWPNLVGVFFAFTYIEGEGSMVIADRGLGVLATLKKAVPDLESDEEALKLAFTKKISSRVLENRGNGLKFVKKNVMERNFYLEFQSAHARVTVNQEMKINKTDSYIQGCLAALNF